MAGLNIRAVITARSEAGEVTAITLGPDYQDGRNAEWAAATPSFSTTMSVQNGLADELEVGQEVEVILKPGRKAADRRAEREQQDDARD